MSGNMYEGVDTWKPLAGACSHACSYCSTRSFSQRYKACAEKYSGPPRLDENELKRNLGSYKRVFVCSTTDLFAADVPEQCIDIILFRLKDYPKNTYMLQSKNPARMLQYAFLSRENWWWGTTIETNRSTSCNGSGISKAPSVCNRANALAELPVSNRYVTIEPVMIFDTDEMVDLIRTSMASKVYIGADSKHHGLHEPKGADVLELAGRLTQLGVEVEFKSNIERLLKSSG